MRRARRRESARGGGAGGGGGCGIRGEETGGGGGRGGGVCSTHLPCMCDVMRRREGARGSERVEYGLGGEFPFEFVF